MIRSRIALAALALGLITVAVMAAPADNPAKDQRSELEGTWKATSTAGFSAEVPKEELQNLEVTFAGNRLSARYGNKSAAGRVELRPGKSPKEIDVTVTEGPAEAVNQPFAGLYRLQGDTLTIVYRAGKDRPTRFDSAGENVYTVEFKRIRR
jgi:uncharacterized protein (TIGR03067 family)